mmetsp:Transcript_868/g.2184  ORF Transcript_868/g.2184 Transcript_868/m.2184 type:complete len:197 (-) Transcript_868:194-784(-)
MLPANFVHFLLATTRSSVQMEVMRCSSWLTMTTPPLKSRMASTRPSMVSMSRWLVGSSITSRCGFRHSAMARLTRNFWPPESVRMSWCGSTSPERPKCPRCCRICSSCRLEPSPGKRSSASLSGDRSPSSASRWCCAMYSILAPRCWSQRPDRGFSFPRRSLRSVLFPQPFLPSSAMRLDWSTEKETFSNRLGLSS